MPVELPLSLLDARSPLSHHARASITIDTRYPTGGKKKGKVESREVAFEGPRFVRRRPPGNKQRNTRIEKIGDEKKNEISDGG